MRVAPEPCKYDGDRVMATSNDRFSLFLPDKSDNPNDSRAIERWANKSGLTSILGGVIRSIFGSPTVEAKFFIQAESVAYTPDAGGNTAIIFPIPFPNGLVTVVVSQGDLNPVRATRATFNYALYGFGLHVHDELTGAAYTTPTVVNYIAVGY